ESWPITGASFILVYKDPPKPDNTKAVLSFFNWAYHNGAKMASELDYVPIPANVVKLVEDTWTKEIKAGGKPVWTAAAAAGAAPAAGGTAKPARTAATAGKP
ncbi:MAG: hypothetical protein JOZ15_02850, partial [Acidobacteria bacterium]|nr:hypothetical protein [Acidobacteriota bacterium]